MDVDVLFGVACEGEQQLFHRHFMHNHAVGLRFDLRRGRGHQRRHPCSLGYRGGRRLGRDGWRNDVPL